MISNRLTFILVNFFSIAHYAQAQTTNCDQLKAENTRLRAELAALKGASTLTAGTSLSTQTDNGIDFKIASVTGDKRNQTVTVTVVLTNKAANKEYFKSDVIAFSDANGEEYKLSKYLIGSDTFGKNLYTGAPLKAVYTFSGVMPTVAAVKLLPYPYSFNTGKIHGSIEFRDLQIAWK